MTIGRNDPCPCGSGKKYKKCCLQADLAAAHQRNEAARQQAASEDAKGSYAIESPAITDSSLEPFEPDRAPYDPYPGQPSDEESETPDRCLEKVEAALDEFEEKDYEEQIQFYWKTLADQELMDDELAFNMLSQLRQTACARGQRQRFAELVAGLRAQWPEVYAQSAAEYLEWLVEDALREGDERLPELVRELAGKAGEDPHPVLLVMRRLEYAGKLDLLREITRHGWPELESAEVEAWASDEFADKAAGYEVLDYVLHAERPHRDDPELHDRLRPYMDVIDVEPLLALLEDMLGQGSAAEMSGETAETPAPVKARRSRGERRRQTKARRQAEGRVPEQLRGQFLGVLHREYGWPLTRARLACEELRDYLGQRGQGYLAEPTQHTGRPRKRAHAAGLAMALCPDRQTLGRHFDQLIDTTELPYYAVVALFRVMPVWLRFLEEKHLVSATERERVLVELKELHAESCEFFAPRLAWEEPGLLADFQGWPGESMSGRG